MTERHTGDQNAALTRLNVIRYYINTHTLCEGVKDFQTTVVLSAFTKIVIHKIRPVPGHPLAPGDDVTHSVPVRIIEIASISKFYIHSLGTLYNNFH